MVARTTFVSSPIDWFNCGFLKLCRSSICILTILNETFACQYIKVHAYDC
mgnify:CR=1 FL=1